jgi:hypothetical protein
MRHAAQSWLEATWFLFDDLHFNLFREFFTWLARSRLPTNLRACSTYKFFGSNLPGTLKQHQFKAG